MKKRIFAAAAALLMLCGCSSDPESENGMQWFSAEFPETVQPSGEQGYAYHDGEILLALILGGRFLIRTVKRFRREDKEAKLREKETAPLSAEA